MVLAGDDAMRLSRARKSLKKRIDPCIPPRRNRVEPVEWNAELYRRRHLVENFLVRPGTSGG